MRSILYKIQNFFVDTPEREQLGAEAKSSALFIFRFMLQYIIAVSIWVAISFNPEMLWNYVTILLINYLVAIVCIWQLKLFANSKVAAISWLVIFIPKLFIHFFYEESLDGFFSLFIWTLMPFMFAYLSLGWRVGFMVAILTLAQNIYLLLYLMPLKLEGQVVGIGFLKGNSTKSGLLFVVLLNLLFREYSSAFDLLKRKIKHLNSDLNSLLEAIPDGCFLIINNKYEILHAQGEYLQLFLGSKNFKKYDNAILQLEKANKLELLKHIRLGMQGKRLNYELNFHQLWFEVYLVPIYNEKKQVKQLNIIAYNITPSKLSAMKVSELSSYLESILDSTTDEIWAVDMNYHTVTSNRALKKIMYDAYGIDVIKTPNVMEQLVSRGFEQISHQLQERYTKVFETGETFQYLDTYSSLKGPIHRTLSFNPILREGRVTGVAIFSKDITELLKIEEQLGQTSSNLERVMYLGKMGHFMLNASIETFTLSQSFLQNILAEDDYYGLEKQFNLVAFFKEYFEMKKAFPYIEEFRQFVTHYKENLSIHHESSFVKTLELQRKNGETIYILANVEPIFDDGGHFMGAVGVAIDITDITLTQRQLEEAKEKAEEATKAKAAFLATMTHELRTPLNAVIGLTHLLQEQNPRPEQIDTLKTLEFSSQTLLSIINEILDYSKLEAGKLMNDESAFAIKELLHLLVSSFKFHADSKKIELLSEIDPQVPPQLIGDAGKIKQILTNLLSNAIKFTKYGRVVFSLQLLEQNEAKVKLRFKVTDTGIGIPADLQGQIFEDFTQARADTYRKYGGTGLGLTITKKLLETMGSKIQLESIEEVGSTFWFDLNLMLPKNYIESNEGFISEPGLGKKENYLKGKKVLLVEDNEINIMVAQKILQQWEMEVSIAYNGYKAIEQTSIQLFDVVLMDLNMPELDGIATTERIRIINPAYHNIPILALTAAGTLELNLRIPGSGLNGVIGKPFQPNELKQKIKEFLYLKEQGLEILQL